MTNRKRKAQIYRKWGVNEFCWYGFSSTRRMLLQLRRATDDVTRFLEMLSVASGNAGTCYLSGEA
jgi:hypothetical protein